MSENSETDKLSGFNKRVQFCIKKLPSKLFPVSEAAGYREHRNFVRIYAAIKVNLSDYQTFEYIEEIKDRLETARKSAKALGEKGMQFLTLDDMSLRGNSIYKKIKGADLEIKTPVQKEYAAGIFENEVAKTETRALAFLRAFETMAELFFAAGSDEGFIEKLEFEYKS